MTHEVAKVTHQEAALASSGIKWEENITVKRWGMGIFWAWLYNKSVAKDHSSMKLVPNKKEKRISHNSGVYLNWARLMSHNSVILKVISNIISIA